MRRAPPQASAERLEDGCWNGRRRFSRRGETKPTFGARSRGKERHEQPHSLRCVWGEPLAARNLAGVGLELVGGMAMAIQADRRPKYTGRNSAECPWHVGGGKTRW